MAATARAHEHGGGLPQYNWRYAECQDDHPGFKGQGHDMQHSCQMWLVRGPRQQRAADCDGQPELRVTRQLIEDRALAQIAHVEDVPKLRQRQCEETHRGDLVIA